MHRWIHFLLMLTALYVSMPPATAQQTLPHWLTEDPRIESGTLQVPEDHDDPQGRKITIAYAVLKAPDTAPAAHPMIFFSGGPGGTTLQEGLVGFLKGHPLLQERDIILFDQRGIGFSSPMPDMSMDSFATLAADASPDKELQLTRSMIREYRERCAAMGIRPQFYNTVQNARDVGMLFSHLGYEKYNLYGGSYGTRIARMVQDLFPEFIHSSVLDSPSPLSGDFLLDRLKSYSKALERIFEYCENQPECREKYPDLQADYFKAIARLGEAPLEVRLNDSIPFVINAQDGVYLLRRLLYQGNSREKAPELIHAFLRGGGEVINQVLQFEYELAGGLNETMLLSVEKYEQFNPANTPEVIRESYGAYPLLPVPLGFFDAFYQAGMDWHPGHMPMEDRVFQQSDVPTLIFVNRYDPVTPPENGLLFREQLSNGHLLILDEGGHGQGNQDCKERVMSDFMNNPALRPDVSCLNLYEQ